MIESAGHGTATLDGGAGDDRITGGDAADTLIGGTGADMLEGRAGNDTLHGGDGDDHLIGGRGSDLLHGEQGDDRLQGDAGDDTLNGGADSDTLVGGLGIDQLNGDAGDDVIEYGFVHAFGSVDTASLTKFGNVIEDLDPADEVGVAIQHDANLDVISGGTGFDTILVAGSDQADELTITSTLNQGNGMVETSIVADQFSIQYQQSSDITLNGIETLQVDGKDGADTISAGGGQEIAMDAGFQDITNLVLVGGDGNDFLTGADNRPTTLIGGEGDDRLQGGQSDDLLYGDLQDNHGVVGGDDTLHGGTGLDVLRGGPGNDHIRTGLDFTGDLIYGESGNDTLVGGPGADLIEGGLGDDTIIGKGLDDRLLGGGGNDWIYGGTGRDVIHGDTDDGLLVVSGNDVLFANFDSAAPVVGVAVSYAEWQGWLNSIVQASQPFDEMLTATSTGQTKVEALVDYVAAADPGSQISLSQEATSQLARLPVTSPKERSILASVLLDIDPDQSDARDYLKGGNGDDELHGSAFRDLLFGGEGDDLLFGRAGDDVLRGGFGSDTLDGGTGEDQIELDLTDPARLAGEVDEVVNATTDYFAFAGSDGDDIFTLHGDEEKLYFSNGSQLFQLNAPNLGAFKEIKLSGGDGNDILDASGVHLSTVLDGGAGNDILSGGQGRDIILGGPGDDQIDGNAGDDELLGGGGGDDIFGGQGADHLFANSTPEGWQPRAKSRFYRSSDVDVTVTIVAVEITNVSSGSQNAPSTLDRLYGGEGNDTLLGSEGHDELYGGIGDDHIVHSAGDDLLGSGHASDKDRYTFEFDASDDRIALGLNSSGEFVVQQTPLTAIPNARYIRVELPGSQ